MSQPNLVALAQQGDPRAIAALVNRHFQPQGIQGRVTVKAGNLHLLLESDTVPDRTTQLAEIARLFREHEIHAFETVMVYGRQQGAKQPAWQDTVDLSVDLDSADLHTVFDAEEPDLSSTSPAAEATSPAWSEPDTLLQHDVAAPASEVSNVSDAAEGLPVDRSNRSVNEPLDEPFGTGWREGRDTNGSGTGRSSTEIPGDFAAFGLSPENQQDDALGDLEDYYTGDSEGLEETDEDAAITDETEDQEAEATGQPWYRRKLGLMIGGLVVVLAGLGIWGWLNQRSVPGDSPLPVESPPQSPVASPATGGAPASPAQTPAASPGADPFREAVNRATKAAQLTQTAKTRQEWETVASQWREAIALMQAVPADSPNYATAQDRAVAYQKNLAYAEQAAASRPE